MIHQVENMNLCKSTTIYSYISVWTQVLDIRPQSQAEPNKQKQALKVVEILSVRMLMYSLYVELRTSVSVDVKCHRCNVNMTL